MAEKKKTTKKPQITFGKLYAITAVIVFTIAGIILGINYHFAEQPVYTLHYINRNGDRLYLTAKRDYVDVEVYYQVQCIKAPCDPHRLGGGKQNYTDEYRQLFDDLFKDKKIQNNELTIHEYTDEINTLTDAQHEFLNQSLSNFLLEYGSHNKPE